MPQTKTPKFFFSIYLLNWYVLRMCTCMQMCAHPHMHKQFKSTSRAVEQGPWIFWNMQNKIQNNAMP